MTRAEQDVRVHFLTLIDAEYAEPRPDPQRINYLYAELSRELAPFRAAEYEADQHRNVIAADFADPIDDLARSGYPFREMSH